MKIVKAAYVSPDLPQDLNALCIYERMSTEIIVRLCAVGDISFSGSAASTFQQSGGTDLITEVVPLLTSSDITFGNLECVLSTNYFGKSIYVAPSEGANILRESGFSILHLANNHIYDVGPDGLSDTLHAIQKVGLLALGAGNTIKIAQRLIQTNRNGITIGWLGCGWTHVKQQVNGPRFWEFTKESIIAAANKARLEVDFLIVSIHKGFMYLDYPAPDEQKLAEALDNVGVDLILMHHAHVLQGIQVMPNGGICCYSLGNFLFDSRQGNVKALVVEQDQKSGAVFIFDLDRSGLVRAAVIPTWIDEFCCVHLAIGGRGLAILRRLRKINLGITEGCKTEFIKQRVERNVPHAFNVLIFHAKRGNLKIFWAQIRHIRFKHLFLLIRWLLAKVKKLGDK